MADGPWNRPPGASQGQTRPWTALAVAALVMLLIWGLSSAFPDAIYSDWDRARLLQLVGALALVSSAVVVGRRFRGREALRNMAIWVGVFAVLILGYSLRNEFANIGTKIMAELVPDRSVQTGAHELTLTADQSDSFYASGTVNGADAEFLIDTGASSIVLSPRDAERAGIDLSRLNFSNQFESAHGDGRGAYFVADRLTVGPITFTQVPMIVNDSPMRSSLLGLTFLRRLDSFEMRGRKLILRWH